MAVIKQYNKAHFSLSHSVDMSPKDEDFFLHIHDNLELLCVVKGKVSYLVEGNIYKLKAGSILLMRAGEIHKLIVNDSQEYERYLLNFDLELFDMELLKPYFERELGKNNLYLPKELNFSAIAVFEKLFKELERLDSNAVLKSNISFLLSSICLAFLEKGSEEKSSEENEIIAYINENLTKPLTLADISSNVHLSISQANRIFKGLMGTSIHDYILSKRLVLFKQKMNEGKSALVSCQECGFSDYSSFYRLYKKRFGVSPTFRG